MTTAGSTERAYDLGRALELSVRGVKSRVIFSALLAVSSSITLNWSVGALWFAAMALWELVLRRFRDRALREHIARGQADTAGLALFAFTAGLSAAVFSTLGYLNMAARTPAGVMLGGGILAGAMTHLLVYYATARPILIATLAPMLVAALAGVFAAFGLSPQAAVGFVAIFALLSSSTIFLVDRDRLQKRVHDQSMALAVARQANEAKSRFISTMSHELRTPLNAIIGYGEIIQEDLDAGAAPERDDAGHIISAARHLLTLVNDVLDLSKLEAGKLELHPEPIDAERLVAQVFDLVRPAAAKKQLRLHHWIDPQLGKAIEADPKRLRQCLLNLVANAVKFTPSGAVSVRIAPAGPGIAAIAVIDTGIGIAPDKLARLFQPFTQIDSADNRAFEGTGLGLAITKRLITEMGGEVAVESRLGQGSTFTLTAPLAPAAQVIRASAA